MDHNTKLSLGVTAPQPNQLLAFLGETLTVALIEILAQAPDGKRRYNQLLHCLTPTSKRTLTNALRRLEHQGVIERRILAQVPSCVEYSLTPLGRSFVEPIEFLRSWAQTHAHELNAVQGKPVKPSSS